MLRGRWGALRTSCLPTLAPTSEPVTAGPGARAPPTHYPNIGEGSGAKALCGRGWPQSGVGTHGTPGLTPPQGLLSQNGSIGMTTLRSENTLPGLGRGEVCRGSLRGSSTWTTKQYAMWLNHPHFFWEILLSNAAMQFISRER